MTWFDLATVFTAMPTPLLPQPVLARASMHLSWAVVLGAAALWLGASWPKPWRWVLAVCGVLWACWPGEVSASHWLGLAFQSPSVISVALCLSWGWQQWQGVPRANGTLGLAPQFVNVMVIGGAALGWCLLGDMLAWWPVSVYAWGFGSGALAVVCAVVGLAWGSTTKARQVTWLGGVLALVLAAFVVTRLPSGNVWDALLDPWLWMGLQVSLLNRGTRWLLRVWRGPAAIHA